MRPALALALLAPIVLVACAVAEYPYPPAWDPLVPQPDSDCREFEGRYADRGESGHEPGKPSLTRELFGEFSDWEDASTVRFAIPRDGVLEVTVSSEKGQLFSRTLNGSDFACRGGRLIVRDKRWIGGYIMSGRQHIEVELSRDGSSVVAQVEEMAYGVMFIIFPIIGTARHWHRFQRLS